MFTAQDLAMMSPDEAELAKSMMAAQAEGRDLTLDPGEQPAAHTAQQPADTTGKELPADDTTVDDTTNNAPLEQATPPAPAPAPAATPPAQPPAAQAPAPAPSEPPVPLHQVRDVAPLREQLRQARDEADEVLRQYTDGDITAEEYKEKITPLREQQDTLQGDIAVAQSLAAANQQAIERSQQAVLETIRANGMRAGVDYSTPGVVAQFNTLLDALDKDPGNATLTFAEIADKAHAAVLALHGKLPVQGGAAAPAPAPTPAAAPAANRQPPEPPPSLRNMPAAQQPNSNEATGSVTDILVSGNAIEMEAAWERLTPAQRQAVLDRRI